ncbi:MAG: efflux RND transporter permease subunit [Xanthomonadales bacterium]|nr:efflux RND transporter permease subunit [Xanthomonadales bacterium]
MNITEKAISSPAAVAVVVALVTLFGLFSLNDLPVQLFPDIDRPQINVNANWRAASPKEVESEILEPMEGVLQGMPGMAVMSSNAFNGGAMVNMQFTLGTDMQATLMEVIGRLNRLPPMPADSNPPVVTLGGHGGGSNEALSWFFVQLLPGTEGPIEGYAQFIMDTVKPKLESIDGVAGVEVNAGAANELQITIDPYKAAEYGIELGSISQRASRSSDVSGGFVDVGRRQYTLRFEGRYDPLQFKDLILEWREGRPIRLGDIADIQVNRGKKTRIAIQNGNPAISLKVDRANGANVLSTLKLVKEAVTELREGPLAAAGLDIQQSFDASVFINRAISMVTNNLLLGVLLAIGILWFFLRDARATILIASAIPISLLSTFIVLGLTGRSLNVISLAGLAFAVGMVLDAAIVVSENIVRLRERGEKPSVAALAGASQVKGALMASTATTVAIFLPVLFLKDVEGQLFADLALTISIAVVISLFVALTILPTVAGSWLKPKKLTVDSTQSWARLARSLMKVSATRKRRVVLIISLVATPLLISWLLFPQLDYLPPVKRDAVDAFIQFPPGNNVETNEKEIISKLVTRLQPYMDGEKQPALKNYYIMSGPGGGTIGTRALDQSRVDELLKVVRTEVLVDIPDFRGFASQGNLFGGFGGGRDIAVHLQSSDQPGLYAAAAEAQKKLMEVFPGANVRTMPSIEMASPELRITPDDARINEVGMDRRSVASLIRTLGNGLWLGEYFSGESRMDIIMRTDGWETPEQLMTTPVVTPSGEVVPLSELVSIERVTGPSMVRRVNGRRTVTVSLNPPDNVSLETAIAQIKAEVEPGLRAVLPADGSIQYGGSADSLSAAIGTMSRNFILALFILFMLMAGLFRSLKDSALVIMTIPLAGVGGVIAIQALNLVTFQPMDLLTMIGFIILLGLVVNNAILLVDQTRRAERKGMNRHQAVESALRVRLRPIFMSTLTSIFGMLPLLLLPGEGSVIYRGLAASIVGGMACSLVFTLLLLPCMLRLGKARQVENIAPNISAKVALESVT